MPPWSGRKDDLLKRFPPGSRAEEERHWFHIYSPDGKRKWTAFNLEMAAENKTQSELSLLVKAGGTTWHTLMSIFYPTSSVTNKALNLAIGLDCINDSGTGNHIYFYSIMSPRLYKGWGGGYYGHREDIVQDIREAGALAVSADELPEEINIQATALRLIETFKSGSFDVPQFVLPPRRMTMRRVISRLRSPK